MWLDIGVQKKTIIKENLVPVKVNVLQKFVRKKILHYFR